MVFAPKTDIANRTGRPARNYLTWHVSFLSQSLVRLGETRAVQSPLSARKPIGFSEDSLSRRTAMLPQPQAPQHDTQAMGARFYSR